MVSINTHQAKTQLSALLAQIESGAEPIMICRNGKPIAMLSSPPSAQAPDPLKQHKILQGEILYDPTEPATEEEWPAMV